MHCYHTKIGALEESPQMLPRWMIFRIVRVVPSRLLALQSFQGRTDRQTDRQPVYILPSLRREVKTKAIGQKPSVD